MSAVGKKIYKLIMLDGQFEILEAKIIKDHPKGFVTRGEFNYVRKSQLGKVDVTEYCANMYIEHKTSIPISKRAILEECIKMKKNLIKQEELDIKRYEKIKEGIK